MKCSALLLPNSWLRGMLFNGVVPAQAGTQSSLRPKAGKTWIPDCHCVASGMTGFKFQAKRSTGRWS
jgi:hypothetical protein